MSDLQLGQTASDLRAVAARRQNERLVVVGVALFALPLIVSMVVLSVQHPNATLTPRGVLVAIAVCLLTSASGVGFVLWSRRRNAAWVQPPQFGGLDRRTRRQLLRAMRLGHPIPGQYEAAARELVNQLGKTR